MRGIPYFRFYPADFMNGVRGMTAQEVGVYTMILSRIYEENGPVEYHPLRLCTYCGMREKTFVKVLEKLIDLGKITHREGMISNDRAEIEISNRANDLKNNSKAGKASAEKRQQNQRNNPTGVEQAFNHTDTDIDIREKRDTNVSPKKKSSSRQIPDDFQPTDAGVKFAHGKGMRADEVQAQVEQFILHHQSKGSKFASIDRAWQTWCANFAKFAAERAARSSNVVNHPRNPGRWVDPANGRGVEQFHPHAVCMGGGWWKVCEEIEWYRNTNETRPNKWTRDRQDAEVREALRGSF